MDGDIIEGEARPAAPQHPVSSSGAGGASPSTTPWGSAFEQWREVKLKEQLTSKWDEAFGLVVEYKESTTSEKHRLVTTVKEFAAAYKQEPSADKVEQLLRFFKRFISGLFERAELSEKHFIGVYQAISMVPDPAPLLFAAHVEITNLVDRVRQLQHDCGAKSLEIADLHRQQTAALRDLVGGGDEGGTSSLSSIGAEMKELRATVEDLRAEKRALVDIVRDGEAHVAAAKEELLVVNEQRRQLSQQLLQSQVRYEEYMARSERDTTVLTAELAEAHEQLLLGVGKRDEPSSGSSKHMVIEALETEVEALRLAMQEAEASHVRELAALAAVVPSHAQELRDGDNCNDNQTMPHLVQRLHDELAATTRAKDELTVALSTERRHRRESQQREETSNRLVAEMTITVKGLQRTIDTLRSRSQAGPPALLLPAPSVVPLETPKSNDEVLAELIATPVPVTESSADATESKLNRLTADDLHDPQLVKALVTQRDALRGRVTSLEQVLSTAEREIERLRRDGQARGGAASAFSVFDERYRSTLLAAIPPPSGAISVDVGLASESSDHSGRRRRKIQQTVRRAADGVAVLVANMVVHSSTTRCILVGYLIGLHVIVMVTTYAMAFRGARSSPSALCAAK